MALGSSKSCGAWSSKPRQSSVVNCLGFGVPQRTHLGERCPTWLRTVNQCRPCPGHRRVCSRSLISVEARCPSAAGSCDAVDVPGLLAAKDVSALGELLLVRRGDVSLADVAIRCESHPLSLLFAFWFRHESLPPRHFLPAFQGRVGQPSTRSIRARCSRVLCRRSPVRSQSKQLPACLAVGGTDGPCVRFPRIPRPSFPVGIASLPSPAAWAVTTIGTCPGVQSPSCWPGLVRAIPLVEVADLSDVMVEESFVVVTDLGSTWKPVSTYELGW
jgi:hypothetical protein